MKAWRVEKHGGPEVLERKEMPLPEPGALEVRVRVEAVGLNHLDVWVRKGVPGHQFPLPLTPGCDVVGAIDALGPGAQAKFPELKEGVRVLLNPGLSCGHCSACLGGFDPLCRHYGILGETTNGGLADAVVAPIQNVIPLGDRLGSTEAAALPIPFLTAWSMLFHKAELRPGETILVQAGGSGVSVAAIQMAKMIGATVITTVGSAEKAAKARAMGADHVIEYRKQKLGEELKRILRPLGKRGCEVVMDHVGADTFADSMKALAWGGRLVTCGATTGGEVKIDLKAVFFKNLSVLGTTMGSKADLIRIVELVQAGKLKPIIDSIFPMADLPQAMARLENRAAFGKVILTN